MTTKTTNILRLVALIAGFGLVMGGVLDALAGVFSQPYSGLGNAALALFGATQFGVGFWLLERASDPAFLRDRRSMSVRELERECGLGVGVGVGYHEPEPESPYAKRLRESAAASESAAAWHYANRLREEIARIDPTTASKLSLKLRDVMTRKLAAMEGK